MFIMNPVYQVAKPFLPANSGEGQPRLAAREHALCHPGNRTGRNEQKEERRLPVKGLPPIKNIVKVGFANHCMSCTYKEFSRFISARPFYPSARHTPFCSRVSSGLRRCASISYAISRCLRGTPQGSRNASSFLCDMSPRRNGSYPISADEMKISRDMPPGSYGAPESSYGAPEGSYGTPESSYGAPEGSYGTPESSYGAPESSYGAPESSYGTPEGSYGAPESSYGTPDGSPGMSKKTCDIPENPCSLSDDSLLIICKSAQYARSFFLKIYVLFIKERKFIYAKC
jgi:hypothetical protein